MSARALSLTLLGLAVTACSNPPYPRGSMEKLYPAPPQPTLRSITVGGRSLQLAEMTGHGHRPVLFIHGSPGDWQAWSRYLVAPSLASYGPLLAVDRPGFGGSGPGQVMPDLRAQAELLAQVIPDGQQAILVGHSLGGPLAAWMTLDHPEKVCAAVLVAGSIAPALEAPRWYNYLAATWLARQLVPAEMIWSNHEILPLQKELWRLDGEWPRLQRPVVVLQGEKDELVDPRTADYAERRIAPQWLRVVRVPEQGHFVLWNQPERVIEAIKSLPCGG